MMGTKPLVWPLSGPGREPTLLASVQLADGRPPTPQERELSDAIGLRHTSRAPFSGQPIPEAVQIELEQQAGFEFALLRMLGPQDAAAALLEAARRARGAGAPGSSRPVGMDAPQGIHLHRRRAGNARRPG
jgi:hypothetical protein